MNHPKTLGQCAGNSRICFRTVRGLSLGLGNCPCVSFLYVMAKMHNGVGCLALRGMFGCILNHGKLPYCGSTHYPDLRTGFWVGNKCNLVVSPSGKL